MESGSSCSTDWENLNFFLGEGVFRCSSSNFLLIGFNNGSLQVRFGRESEIEGVRLNTTGRFSVSEPVFLNLTFTLRWLEILGLQMENLAFGLENENEKVFLGGGIVSVSSSVRATSEPSMSLS